MIFFFQCSHQRDRNVIFHSHIMGELSTTVLCTIMMNCGAVLLTTLTWRANMGRAQTSHYVVVRELFLKCISLELCQQFIQYYLLFFRVIDLTATLEEIR